MGKKNRKKNKNKKNKPIKTKEERTNEVNLIRNKINSLGLSEEHIGIPELFTALDIFKNEGFSNSGKIKLVGLKRVIEYILTCKPNIESSICLKYNPDV